MTILTFSLLLFFCAILAGVMGGLTGLGGGFIITPVLVLGFGIDPHYAIGTSLMAVLATSTGANLTHLKKGYVNLRIGILLESVTVVGALIGALLVPYVSASIILLLFGLLLLFSSCLMWLRPPNLLQQEPSHPWAKKFHLEGIYTPTQSSKLPSKPILYHVSRVPAAMLVMSFAGATSGFLGIGSGTLKVLAMDQAMRLPYKVSTATSNFMIGITAAVSVGVYFIHGYMQMALIFPVILGVLLGAWVGAEILHYLKPQKIRLMFSALIFLLGLQMIYQGIGSI